MKDAVGTQLWDQQAGFRRGRSCTDKIAIPHIILEQSCQWNCPLYVNFIDYEKTFDNLDGHSLWKLLRQYGVPEKITSIIRNAYSGMTQSRQLTDAFQVQTGVRQGPLLSPFVFLLAIEWLLKTSLALRGNGIQWTPWTQLDDLDIANDLALLSHAQRQMQEKTSTDNSARLGLRVYRGKSKIFKNNAKVSTSSRTTQKLAQTHNTGGRWIRRRDEFHLPR